MKIDPKTLLFTETTAAERTEILAVAEAIVLHGRLPNPRPAWIDEWLRVGGYDEKHYLVLASTMLPQWMLLSIVREMGQ